MLSNLTDLSGDYDPIPEEMGMRILRIIWNNLEDSLSQTVKQ
ncbi:putative death receptor interacting protein, partial [Trifolium medium]|nr:putative death receptor interacting protein [Trifolium medium]